MRPNQNFKRALKVATLTVGLALVVLAVSAVRDTDLRGRLVPVEQRRVNREIPTVHYDASRAVEGFSAPADTHVIFTIPENARIARNVFFGPEYDLVHYWGYCFKGDERLRKENGYTGMKIYHENRFFYSLAEQRAQGGKPKPSGDDLLGILESLHSAAPKVPDSYHNVFQGGETCYVMSAKELPAGLDADSDLLNAALERMHNTNPSDPDTDNDGISDGDEFYTTKTNPLQPDTDGDGLDDLCEDKDQDGYLDDLETSPTNTDTDRDDLCDGTGTSCSVGFTSVRTRINGEWVWNRVPESPVWTELGDNTTITGCPSSGDYFTSPTNPSTFGEMPDWDYQWDHFVGGAVGTPKPQIPIPDLPGKDLETDPS